jgi:zinc protease
VRRLSEETYGQLPARGERPGRFRPREPEPVAARHITVADTKVEQTTLQRLYLVPSCCSNGNRDCYALELLAEVIGGGPTSYLYRALVLEQGVAVNAGAWYMSSAMEETRFSVYAVPAQGVSLEKLEEAVDAALRAISAKALDGDAIERAKVRLVAETIYSTDSQSSLARIYGSALAIGETLDDVRRWPGEIEAVLKDDLASVAERFLIPRRSVTGYLQKPSA